MLAKIREELGGMGVTGTQGEMGVTGTQGEMGVRGTQTKDRAARRGLV